MQFFQQTFVVVWLLFLLITVLAILIPKVMLQFSCSLLELLEKAIQIRRPATSLQYHLTL